MSRPMRIKVRVADLISKVEEARTQAKIDYEKALQKYAVDIVRYMDACVDALTAALDKVASGKTLDTSTSWMARRSTYQAVLQVPVKMSAPEKPTLNLARFDKDLGLLKACADETLMVSADSDFGRYL